MSLKFPVARRTGRLPGQSAYFSGMKYRAGEGREGGFVARVSHLALSVSSTNYVTQTTAIQLPFVVRIKTRNKAKWLSLVPF